jgi:hypothetical protein
VFSAAPQARPLTNQRRFRMAISASSSSGGSSSAR